MADKNTVKNWFKTGLKPTQAQFWSFFDSILWKGEKLPASDIEGIDGILEGKADAGAFTSHLTDAQAHAAEFGAKEDKNKKGVAGGYAPLDEFTKIAAQYLSIVNDLATGGINAVLSAEMGLELQRQVNAINTLLTSDDVNLDTVQEIVDAIKQVETSLETILVNDLTTGGVTKALTAEMGKTLNTLKANDADVLHKTGNEVKTGTLAIGRTTPYTGVEINQTSIIHRHESSGNISFRLNDLAPSQGAFSLGTNTVNISMREDGPRYISVTDPIESPNGVSSNHLVTKGQLDAATPTLTQVLQKGSVSAETITLNPVGKVALIISGQSNASLLLAVSTGSGSGGYMQLRSGLGGTATIAIDSSQTENVSFVFPRAGSGMQRTLLLTVNGQYADANGNIVLEGAKAIDVAAVASAVNEGTIRYRKSGNNSYAEMCMQSGAATYAWVAIIQNNW